MAKFFESMTQGVTSLRPIQEGYQFEASVWGWESLVVLKGVIDRSTIIRIGYGLHVNICLLFVWP